MSDNLAIWDALCRTDPTHTKSFNRAGGFKGTAIKPIWITRRLTEQFGPAGIGWGVNEPTFQVVSVEGEILVYCTVSVWHTDRENLLWGVGGDKVQAKRKDGSFNDDEAFKKAFTDAVNNAVKSIGVGADVHMGLFDDDKYVTQAKAEFAAEDLPASVRIALDKIRELDTEPLLKAWWKGNSSAIPESHYEQVVKALNDRLAQIKTLDIARAG